MFFPSGTALLASPAPGQWTSPSDLSLLIQAPGDSPFAWTSRLAQQSLQSDFDPVLLQLFDGQPQGDLREVRQQEGQRLEIEGEAVQASLTNSFGFVDVLPDASAAEDVGNGTRVARPLAGATTAGGLDNQQAVVRLRQNSSSDLAVLFYRVDDLTGMIKGVAPGEKGYKRLSRQRAYETAEGVRWIPGPGDGGYTQQLLTQVNAGDLIAMRLSTGERSFWGFARANETVDGAAVGHLWNYGLNTWGWEDQFGGGDRDFNDLIAQLDFTSAAGRGFLV